MKQARAGFTLIELLAVVTIVAILMGLAIASSVHWGRSVSVRASALEVRAALGLARQWALTHGVVTHFHARNEAGGNRAYYAVLDHGGRLIGHTNYMSEGVVFASNCVGSVLFGRDGSCLGPDADWPGNVRALVLENARDNATRSATVLVYRVTGYCAEVPE